MERIQFLLKAATRVQSVEAARAVCVMVAKRCFHYATCVRGERDSATAHAGQAEMRAYFETLSTLWSWDFEEFWFRVAEEARYWDFWRILIPRLKIERIPQEKWYRALLEQEVFSRGRHVAIYPEWDAVVKGLDLTTLSERQLINLGVRLCDVVTVLEARIIEEFARRQVLS